jgi:hypothetical protein
MIQDKNIEEILRKFTLAMERAVKLFDDYAFRISTPTKIKNKTPINKSLFDVWSILLSKMQEQQFDILLNNREMLFQKLDKIFDDKGSSLRRNIGTDSIKISGVKGRYETIGNIINELILEADS